MRSKKKNEKELFRVYTQNNHVMNLVKSQATAAESLVERYGDVIYLIPKEENEYLGFNKTGIKSTALSFECNRQRLLPVSICDLSAVDGIL